MSERSPTEIISKLSDRNRNEDRRVEDVSAAFEWLRTELDDLKQQDKLLMRRFNYIREQLNKINQLNIQEERVRSSSEIRSHPEDVSEAQRCNIDPFDADSDDDNALRRRAFSSSALPLQHRNIIKTATFAEVY